MQYEYVSQDVNIWLEEDPQNVQDLSEVAGILELMHDIQGDTDAKEQEATIELENLENGIASCLTRVP